MTWTPPSFPHNLITLPSSWLEYLILLLNTITKFLPIFDIQVPGNSGPSFRRAGSWGSILWWKRDLIPKWGIMELFLIIGNMITFWREGSRGSFQLWEHERFSKWGIKGLFPMVGTGSLSEGRGHGALSNDGNRINFPKRGIMGLFSTLGTG